MEFKIITGTAKECEEKLNKLQLDYDIKVISMSANENLTTILLYKTPLS